LFSNCHTVSLCEFNGLETFFVGKDVADALGYTNTPKAIRDHVDDDDKLTERFVLSGQTRSVIIINESGLYALVLSSKLPQATDDMIWEVCHLCEQEGWNELPKPRFYPRPHRELLRAIVAVSTGISYYKIDLKALDAAYSEAFPHSTPINVNKKRKVN
jgi:hypothetical protein